MNLGPSLTRAGVNRRQAAIFLAGAFTPVFAASDPIIETHVHLFSNDVARFPGHKNAWPPSPSPLEGYVKFARTVGITHAIHVSAEPYQDDLRYLEYTLDHAPEGFLKGTLLLDATRDDTPARMAEYVRKRPNRIVALRVHCTRARNQAPTTTGPIRDRDLLHPGMRKTWRKAGDLGIAIQAHIQPWFSEQIERIASDLPETRVILDHFGHAGVGAAVKAGNGGWQLGKAELGYRDPKEFDQVLRLAKLPQVILKVSSLQYSSREPHPHRDIRPLARRAFESFGPDRMIAGSLGSTIADFKARSEVFDTNFDFLSASDRAKIRGLTAKKLFAF
jgi:L-fuconolactonase